MKPGSLSAARAIWDFGDYPFGLEPLFMPVRGVAAEAMFELPVEYDAARTLDALALPAEPGPALEPPPSEEVLYWFRWITGHQVSFLLWHLMGELIRDIGEAEGADASTLASLEAYTRGYSAMLLYTGSSSPAVYQNLIRPRMYLQHRGFSGVWATDFAPLRKLLRGRDLPWLASPEAAGLAAAVARNRATHELIAARLVPSGRSLLQQAIASAEALPAKPSARTAAIFDSFFMTVRAPIGRDAVVGQLLHRLRAVGLDLATNELHKPEADDFGMVETEYGVVEILLQVVASVLTDNERLTTSGVAS